MIRRPRACRVVFDGQSRVAIPTYDGFLGYSWGRLVMLGRNLPGYVVAESGKSIAQLTANFATRAQPIYAGPISEPSIAVLGDIGASSIIDEAATAASVYSQACAYADLCRAAGAVYVIACTTLPSDLFATPTMEAARLAANALYMADASNKFDASVELCVDGLTDIFDRDVYLDRTHLFGPFALDGFGAGFGTPRAADVVRPYIDAAIDAVT